MPHALTLSDETFIKLQKLAKPFVDTPESVIAALADEALERRSIEAPARLASESILRVDPDQHESLTHARLISATVDSRALHRPKWNGLLHHMHLIAKQRLGSFDAVQRVSGANLRDGRYEEDGFQYLPEAGFSLQGVDSNLAWDHSLRLARHLRLPIEVRFEWRVKDGAAHPGKVANIQWAPPSLSVA
jgi:hypothetical protein